MNRMEIVQLMEVVKEKKLPQNRLRSRKRLKIASQPTFNGFYPSLISEHWKLRKASVISDSSTKTNVTSFWILMTMIDVNSMVIEGKKPLRKLLKWGVSMRIETRRALSVAMP